MPEIKRVCSQSQDTAHSIFIVPRNICNYENISRINASQNYMPIDNTYFSNKYYCQTGSIKCTHKDVRLTCKCISISYIFLSPGLIFYSHFLISELMTPSLWVTIADSCFFTLPSLCLENSSSAFIATLLFKFFKVTIKNCHPLVNIIKE